ncbi:MAG: NAD(P)H-dependent oxidoreductase [Candidatus Dormiibacterota bacterium]
MNLFRLDASIRREGSVTRALADTAQAGWQSRHPDGLIKERDLGMKPLPATAWREAALAMGDTGAPTVAQRRAIALAAELVDELDQADALLLAIPIYNFGVPQHVKAWVDLIYTDPRMRPRSTPLLAAKPALLLLARGGDYREGSPRQDWDHNTPWLRRIFEDVWGLDLRLNAVELTLANSNPAMEPLRGEAAEALEIGLALARSQGEELLSEAAQQQVA